MKRLILSLSLIAASLLPVKAQFTNGMMIVEEKPTATAARMVRQIYVMDSKNQWDKVADDITKGCITPYDKAKAIYKYLAKEIAYDTSLKIREPDECWKKRLGVCQAYCNLFYHIGLSAGLDVRIIYGKGKVKNGETMDFVDHSWVAVSKKPLNPEDPDLMPTSKILRTQEELNGYQLYSTKGMNTEDIILIEPTWGAGSVIGGLFYQNKDDMSWFDVDPRLFVCTHYPNNESDQRLSNALSNSDFMMLPAILPKQIPGCWNKETVLKKALNDEKFPLVYSNAFDNVDYLTLPVESTLRVGSEYTIAVHKRSSLGMAIFNEGKQDLEVNPESNWKVCGDSLINIFTPKLKGKLKFGIQKPDNPGSYNLLIEYDVPEPTAAELAALEAKYPYESQLLNRVSDFNSVLAQQRNINIHELLDKLRRGDQAGMPTLFTTPGFECELTKLPFVPNLTIGNEYTVQFLPKTQAVWKLQYDGDWHDDWQVDSETGAYSMTFKPTTAGECRLYVKSESESSYSAVFNYDVK